MALSQNEINQKISEILSSESIKTVYAAIGRNVGSNLRYIMQMAAVYGVESEFKTFEEWNKHGLYIKRGEKSYSVNTISLNAQPDTIRLFTCDQLQKSNGYKRKNTRTMQSLLETLNRITVLKSASEKAGFEDIQTAISRYIQENYLIPEEYSRDYATMTNAIAGVIAYTTCDFTGEGFTPVGLPYGYLENAAIIRDVVYPCVKEIFEHISNEELKQEEEKKANATRKPIITATENGTQTNLFDVPVQTAQQVVKQLEEKKHAKNSLYERYEEIQKQYPNDVVFYRVGDFFEVMGEKAKLASEWANLTLTGRDIGLAERVPMCGIPYHAFEKYLNLITEHSGVVVASPEKEPVRIKSLLEELAEVYPIENGFKSKVFTESELAAQRENGLKANIKDWYSGRYPDDEAVEEIKADATFKDLNDALNNGQNIAPLFTDSVIRERIFAFLSEILAVSYNEIYNLWLKTSDTLNEIKAETDNRMLMADSSAINDELEPHPYYNNLSSEDLTSITVTGAEGDLSELRERLLSQGYSVRIEHGGLSFDILDDDLEALEDLIGNDKLTYQPTDSIVKTPQEPKVIIEWSENLIIDSFAGKELTLGFADKLIRDVYTSREMEQIMEEGGYDKTKYRLVFDESVCPLFRDATKREFMSLFPNKPEEVANHFVPGEFKNRIDSDERCGIIEQIDALYSAEKLPEEDTKAEYEQVRNELLPYLNAAAERTRDIIEVIPEYVQKLLSQDEIKVSLNIPSNYVDENGEVCNIYEHYVTQDLSYVFIAPSSKFNKDTATLDNSERDVKYIGSDKSITAWFSEMTDYSFSEEIDFEDIKEQIRYQFANQTTLRDYRQINEVTINGEPFKPYKITPLTETLPLNANESSFDIEGLVTEQIPPSQSVESFGGKVKRCTDNIAAIRTLKILESEDRTPTAEERAKLSAYVGWGGIPEIFDEHNENWAARRAELKSLLTPSQYNDARASVVNSFFTSDVIVRNIYAGIERMGIRDGGTSQGEIKVLEPAMGIGAFAKQPPYLAVNSSFTGVELDEITAKIAQRLRPLANIINSGFQNTTFEDNTFDLVVGNVPFGEYGVYDENFKNNFKIHDYFIAKSVQKVHEGGLVAVITSSGTMDKLDSSARKYIADRAELVGAIRLPNSAFKNANTDVMTDILFLRKREKQIDSADEWVTTSEYQDTGLRINNYFITHPEMVLGELSVRSSQYGPKLGVVDGELSINDALSQAIQNLPENVYAAKVQNSNDTAELKSIPIDGYENLKNFCYEIIDNTLYQRQGNKLIDCTFTGKGATQNFERASAMIEMRKQVRKILNLELESCTDATLESAQQELTQLYQKFVPKYGNINNAANTRCFKNDADWALLASIEKVVGEEEIKGKPVKIYGKNDIFTKRTIRPYVEIKHVDNVRDALQVSKNYRNVVDIQYIAELSNRQPDEVVQELGNLIYRNPEMVVASDKYSGYETAEEYLSGDVKTKLSVAINAANTDASYKANVDALNSVQPERITADKIGVKLGARWVDTEIYQKFVEHILGLTESDKLYQEMFSHGHWKYVDLQYESLTDEYILTAAHPYDRNTNATTTYGTHRMSADKILEATLNLRPVTVYDSIEDENGKKKRVVNKEQTVIAREKQQRIIEEFKDWIFDDYERRTYLEDKYNRIFNRIVLRQYNGEHLEFPGMNPEIKLNAHQKAAVYRSICQGGTLLHHPVGSGKTFTMCATAMKLKEYGLAKKPMIVVPNPIIDQFAGDFRRLYPNANLLIATEEDVKRENRKQFIAKVAMGDWDAVIMMQSSFDSIRVSKERELRLRNEELSKIDETIDLYSEQRGKNVSIRRLEQTKRSVEKEIEKLTNSTKFDDLINFEDLGVDYLFIDEAHNYKNKFLFTKMTNVAGIASRYSKRASYLDFKIDYLNELHKGDKGVVFSTGTPISNSMTEMYTMMSYLQKNKMRSLGFKTFDAWASTFGETVNSLELAPSGNGYRMKTRFAKFTNLPELLTLYNDFADVKVIGELGLKLPTAHKQTIAIKPGADTEMVMGEIAQRAERIYQGGVDPSKDNMLKITTDGKKTALDVRLIDSELSDADNSKVSVAATNIARIYHANTDKLSTQFVFCDLSTPLPNAFESYVPGVNFNVYCELKHKLIELGVNPDEIQFIHDHDKNTDNLFRQMNAGKVRVLIGSTAKCGVGTNCQERLIALHHLDTPYRPADLEQREGRIVRQGNTNDDVELYTYVTERTFDAYSYQILENKQRFISQIGHVDSSIREIEDVDEKTLSYAEVKALTASNPLIKRKFELESKLQDLRTLKSAYQEERYKTEKAVNDELPWRIKFYTQTAQKAEKDIERYNANKTEDYIITINGEVCKRSEETAEKFAKALEVVPSNVPFAQFAGFNIVKLPVERLDEAIRLALVGEGEYAFSVTETALGTLNRIKNVAEKRIEEIHSEAGNEVKVATQSLEQAKVLLNRGFEHEEELKAIQSELIQIDMELNLDKKEIIAIDGDKKSNEDDEQYWSFPDMEYGKDLKQSAFSITNGVETFYYENTTGVSMKELCEKYADMKKPFIDLAEYGKRINAVRFAEIQQNTDTEYTVEFDALHNTVNYTFNDKVVLDEPIHLVLAQLRGRADAEKVLENKRLGERREPMLYEFMTEQIARKHDYNEIADVIAYREPEEGQTPNPNFKDTLADFDTYILKRTLNHYYRYRTSEGHQVRDILTTPNGRKVALIERENGEYIGAIDYNEETSEWKQGYYELYSLEDANTWHNDTFVSPIVTDTVAVQPDYSISAEQMHEYGYNWDGMLPMEQTMAITLHGMGFDIFRLHEDGTEGQVEQSDYIGDEYLYGIEKSHWLHFINSEEGQNYIRARLSVLEATFQSQGDTISDKLKNEIWDEMTATTAFTNELVERGIVFNPDKYQKYLPELMKNMVSRVRVAQTNKSHLDGEITNEIYQYLDKDCQRAYTHEIEYLTKLHGFIDEGLKGFKFLNGEIDKIVGESADDLTAWLKEHFEGSEFAAGVEGDEFDEWYDAFSEEVVKPYIEDKIYKREYYLCGYYKTNPNQKAVTSLAYSSFENIEDAKADIESFNSDSAYEKVEVRECLYPAKLDPASFSYMYEQELRDSSTLAWSTELEDMLDVEDIENSMQPTLIGVNSNYAGRIISNYYLPGELTEERLKDLVKKDAVATEYAIFANKCSIPKEELKSSNVHFVQLNLDITPEEITQLIIRPMDSATPTINMTEVLDRLYDVVDRMPKNAKEEVEQKIKREYTAFRDDLIKKSGAAVYDEYYKIHFYEELYQYFIYSEGLPIDSADWEILNNVDGGILKDMYQDFLGSEFARMGDSEDITDFVRGYIEDLQDNQYFAMPNVAVTQNDFKQTPIYSRTAQHAFANNEVELYRNSNRVNRACLESLREVTNANYKDNKVDTVAILSQLLSEYGAERLSYVLAMVVRNCEDDARISKDNFAWATTIDISEDEQVLRAMQTPVHQSILDGLVKTYREEFNNSLSKNEFDKDSIYYDVWWTQQLGKNIRKYYVDFFSFDKNGDIIRQNQFFGDITEEEVDSIIKERQDGENYIKLDFDSLDKIRALRSEQQARKIQDKRAVELQKAKEEQKTISGSELYELTQQLETDLRYGAIDEEEYNHRRAVLSTMRISDTTQSAQNQERFISENEMTSPVQVVSPVRQQLVEQIKTVLKSGDLRYLQNLIDNKPISGQTGNAYKGINNIILAFTATEKGYTDPRWLTFSQIKKNNWSLKKDTKGTAIELCEYIDKTTKKPFDRNSVAQLSDADKKAYWNENVYPIYKKHIVFNASCVEGIDKYVKPQIDVTSRSERCEKILTHSESPIINDSADKPYYKRTSDTIHLPKRERYGNDEDYYAIALHEIAHSTGAPDRLNRVTGVYGSAKYAEEELCAELASLMIQQDLKLPLSNENLKLHTEYIKKWFNVLNNDPTVLYKSITQADKISQYVKQLETNPAAAKKFAQSVRERKSMQNSGNTSNFFGLSTSNTPKPAFGNSQSTKDKGIQF